MVFCTNCGTQLDDNVKVCPTCGQQQGVIPAAAQGAAGVSPMPMGAVRPARAPMSSAKKKKLLAVLIAAAVAVIALIIFIVVMVNRPKSFSIKDAVIISVEGYDTMGNLELRPDTDLMEMNLMAAKSNLRENTVYEIIRSLKFTATPTEKQSNGQEVTIRVTANEQMLQNYRLRLAETEWTYTVTGLDEIQTIDPFEGVTVEYTGISPYLRAEVRTTRSDGPFNGLRYSADKSDGLAIGDKVKVTVDYGWTDEEGFLKNYGAKLSSTEKEFTVENADKYVTSPSEIDEQTLTRMQREALDVIEAYIANLYHTEVFVNDALTYEGCAVMMGKESRYSGQNRVWLIYSTTFSASEEGKDGDYLGPKEPVINYFPICFYDVISYQDGTIDYNDRSSRVEGGAGVGYYKWYSNENYVTMNGYADTTTMMTDLIRKNTDSFNYELSEELEELF